MSNSPTNVNDYDAISTVIRGYLGGAISGRSDDMKAAFHEQATIFGHLGADLVAGPIQNLYDWNDENGAAPSLHAQIASIDLVNTVATVRLEIDNWTGHRFTDLFTLMKVEGKWKIMNKVFHLHQ